MEVLFEKTFVKALRKHSAIKKQVENKMPYNVEGGFLMTTIEVALPDEAFSALGRSPDEFGDELKLAAAIHWYRRGVIPQERAATIAGLDRTDFLNALAREQVDAFVVDFDSLHRELEDG